MVTSVREQPDFLVNFSGENFVFVIDKLENQGFVQPIFQSDYFPHHLIVTVIQDPRLEFFFKILKRLPKVTFICTYKYPKVLPGLGQYP